MSNLRTISESVNPSTESSPPPSSITWGGEILSPPIRSHQNIDTIHFGLFVSWPNEKLLLQLESLKDQARANDFNPVPFHIPGINMEFVVSPYGKKGGYAFSIKSADVVLFFSRHDPGGNTPNVFVEIGSISCWSSGVNSVVKNIYRLIEFFDGYVLKENLNRIDMAVDFVGLDIKTLPLDNVHLWIKKAQKTNIFFDGLDFSGVVFGAGGDLSLRTYDKTREISSNPVKQAVFAEVWGLSSYDEQPTTRIEFQLRKEVLKDFKIKTFNQLKGKMASLWRYCTEEWCRLASAPVDRNNTEKSNLHSWWEVVQAIKWSGVRYIKRSKEIARKALDGLIKQAAGLALTAGAILYRQSTDIDGIIYAFQGMLEGELRKQFVSKYLCRRAECWSAV